MKRVLLLFAPCLCASVVNLLLSSAALAGDVRSLRVEPDRIDVGTVMVLRGKGFRKAGATTLPIARWTGVFKSADGSRVEKVSWSGVPTIDHDERASLVVDGKLRGLFKGEHGTWYGRVRLEIQGAKSGKRVFEAPRVVLDVFPVSMRAITGNASVGVVDVLIMIAAALLCLLLVMAPFAGIATLVERRVSGRMQKRIGANRVGPQGLLQWVADAVKLLLKEDIIPTDANPILFRLAPYLVFIGVYLTFAALPFTTSVVVADFNLGILYLIAVTALVVVGLLMAGWASNNKWALLGGMRSAAQIVSYEIPTALALLVVVVSAGTASTQSIIAAQGGSPWNWFVFYSPLHFAAFFLYFSSALAEGNRTPFDLPEAESELVSGYNTEYSGMRFAFFFLGEFANIYVMSAIAVVAFLGGWRIPGVGVGVQEASIALQFVGLAIFMAKTLLMAFVVIWLRWTLPRFRVDQMMSLCWKYFVPIGFVLFVGAAAWEMFPPTAITIGRFVMFAVGLFVAAFFVVRVRYHLRLTGARIAFNPFKLMFQDAVPKGDHVPFAVASLGGRAQGLPATAWIWRRPPAPPPAAPPPPGAAPTTPPAVAPAPASSSPPAAPTEPAPSTAPTGGQ